jgi:PAS domain S-box-containing protein
LSAAFLAGEAAYHTRDMDHPIWSSDPTVKALAAVAPDPLVIVDTRGRIVAFNSLAERLFGYQRHELLGNGLELLVPERYRATQASHLAAYAAAPRPRAMDRRLDIVGQRKDGSEFPADITLRPLPTQAGPVVVAAIRDITERKQLEDERTALLEREQAARAEAEAAVRLRDAFLAAATHDLKNPLMTITIWGELLEQIAPTLGPSEAAEHVLAGARRILKTSMRMAAILQQLLDVARLQMGQLLVLDRSATDLVEMARQAVAEYQETTERHVLRLQADRRRLVGLWDPGRLARVLDNLLGNAIKYSPGGGTITVGLARSGSSAILTVSDQGIGIPTEDQPHLFDWFRRGSNAAGIAAGAGLGLAGVRQVVEQHGGTIAVESREGEGTTFTLRLPLGTAPRRPRRPAGQKRPGPD